MKTIITSLIITLILCLLYIRGYIKAEIWDLSEESRKRFRELYFPNINPKGLQSILDRVLICLTLLIVFLCYKGIL